MINASPPPTGADGEVDWDAVAARSRRRLFWGIPALAVWVGCFAVTFDSPWYAVGFVLVAALVLGLVAWRARRVRGGRPSSRDAVIAEYAVVHMLDPGPCAREMADRRAQRAAAMGLSAPLFVLLGLYQFQRFADDLEATPVTVGAVSVLALGFLTLAGLTWRMAQAGRRWSASPPGPPRPAPVPTPRESFVMGRRYRVIMIVGASCFLLALLLDLGEWVFGW